MSKKGKSKYYVVWVGQSPGIYTSWSECQLQIKGFPNAKFKAFKTEKEAKVAFGGSAVDHIKKAGTPKESLDYLNFKDEIIMDSWSVDAACSGNPGIMEYRGVFTDTKEEIFKMGPFKNGTNNIGEFLALIHALALLTQKKYFGKIIYTDSRTALSWLRNKKVKTTLKPNRHNKQLFVLLNRAIHWMNQNEIKNKIIKWNTQKWGEIPADFGRK